MGINFSSGGSSFADPGRSFANLEAALVASMVTASTDIAMLIDADGKVTDIATRESDLFGDVHKSWIGKRFIDTVTTECRPKVEKLLLDDGSTTRREINHPMAGGADLPISYSVLTLSQDGARIALGRDLRTISDLQQKLVETQLAMESDYARLRNAEAQYRVLFDTANEPICIVDAGTRKIVEVNSSARRLLGSPGTDLVGLSLGSLFSSASQRDLDELIAATRASGDAESADLVRAGDDRKMAVSARFYRQQGATRISVRLGNSGSRSLVPGNHDLIAKAGRELPDAIVVVDEAMQIVAINESFLDLAEIATSSKAIGQSFSDMIGRRGVEIGVLKNAIDADGHVRNFSTVLNSDYGGDVEVELSGTALDQDGTKFYGFSLRRASRSTPSVVAGAQPLRSPNDLTGLVGRVALRDIVRETVDIIEQLCIEAALDMTRNNRASASEMLGLSRQSLYSKLRRYGIGDLGNGDDNESIA